MRSLSTVKDQGQSEPLLSIFTVQPEKETALDFRANA